MSRHLPYVAAFAAAVGLAAGVLSAVLPLTPGIVFEVGLIATAVGLLLGFPALWLPQKAVAAAALVAASCSAVYWFLTVKRILETS